MNYLKRYTTPVGQAAPMVIGHRGLAWSYPENTLASYQAAADAGADMIELDFHATADGVLACVHDGALDRYLGQTASPELRKRPISSLTWEELSRADVGQWKGSQFAGARVPRLSEVLEQFVSYGTKGPTFLLERKGGSPEQTLALLQQFDAVERVIVQSFDWEYLKHLHELAPTVVLAALGGGSEKPFSSATPGDVIATGARIVHWGDAIGRQGIANAHESGLPVWIYTLNSELACRGAQAIGVDGITTDRCDFMRELLCAAEGSDVKARL